MSLVSIIGPRPNLFDLEGASRLKRLEVRQPILTNEDLEKIRAISEVGDGHFKSRILDTTWPAEQGAAGLKEALDRICARAEAARSRRHQHHHFVGPPRRRREYSDPFAARLRGGASSSYPPGAAHLGRAGGGIRRAARGASFLLPGRLWRGGDQPVSGVRNADCDQGRAAAEARRRRDHQALHQVDRQGHSQGDVQDGHLHLSILLRCADFRCRRSQVRLRGGVFHRHRHPHRRRVAHGDRRGERAPAPRCIRRCSDLSRCPRRRRRVPVPGARRGPRLDRNDRVGPAARRARQPAGPVSRICPGLERAIRAPADHPRSVPDQASGRGPPQAGADRGGRAGQAHRAPLLDRRNVVRLDLTRGAYHIGDRHESHRRQVEYRRRRRGSRPFQAAAERRFHALGDQAGGLGPFRGDDRISRQLRHDADQDGAGRQAR